MGKKNQPQPAWLLPPPHPCHLPQAWTSSGVKNKLFRVPRTGVMDSFLATMWVLGFELGPLQEQSMLLTTELSLQFLILFYCLFFGLLGLV